MSRPAPLAPTLAMALMAVAACDTAPPDPRVAWVQGGLCTELQATIARDPSAVADKLALMASEPFIYFRGSLALWRADTTRADGSPLAASGIDVPEARWIMLVGDPHPENAGTFRVPGPGRVQAAPGDGGAMTIEWNDFDAATWGPWLEDVRRLATGVELVLDEASLTAEARARAVEAVVAGYAAGLAAPDARGSLPRFATELVARAESAGGDREELAALDHEDAKASFVDDERFVQLDAAEQALVATLLGAWAPTVAGLDGLPEALRQAIARGETRAVARRLGVGIASFALRRFDLWFDATVADDEADTEGDGDDEAATDPVTSPLDGLMIEFKEVAPAPTWTLPAAHADRALASPAARSVAAERVLQGDPRGDALLGFVGGPDASFRVRERTAYQKGFERERLWAGLRDGTLAPDDAVDFARFLGRLLGEAHARAPRLEGGTAQAALLAQLADPAKVTAFAAETRAFAETMAERTRRDQQTLQRLIAVHGPLIGCGR